MPCRILTNFELVSHASHFMNPSYIKMDRSSCKNRNRWQFNKWQQKKKEINSKNDYWYE